MKNLLLSFFLVFTTLGIAQIGVTAGYNFNDKNVNLSSYSIGIFKNLRQDYKVDLQPYLEMKFFEEKDYNISEREYFRRKELSLGSNVDYYLNSLERSWFIRGGAGIGINLSELDYLFKPVKVSGVIGLGKNISKNTAIVLRYLFNFIDPIQPNAMIYDFSISSISVQIQLKLN